MTPEELEDLENHLASHLQVVKSGAGHWAKAMKLIENTVSLQVQKALEADAAKAREAVELAYSKGYQAGQGLKG